jgi:hypothetical protein
MVGRRATLSIVADEPYRAPLPVTPPPPVTPPQRRGRWPRVAVALVVGLLGGLPISLGAAALPAVILDLPVMDYRRLLLIPWELLCVIVGPFVVGRRAYRALGRTRSEALLFVAGTVFLALLGLVIANYRS